MALDTDRLHTCRRTRFTDCLDGALGAMVTGTGDATIPLVDPHGNNVTSITIPATAATSEACTGIDAWNSYTEYGTPSAGTTPSGTVTGPLGYGWLGTHQRATGPDTAGLTLMGVRYYNPVTGAFTSPDPIPGGNNTSYGYPGDPINSTDISGECSWLGMRQERRRLGRSSDEEALARNYWHRSIRHLRGR